MWNRRTPTEYRVHLEVSLDAEQEHRMAKFEILLQVGVFAGRQKLGSPIDRDNDGKQAVTHGTF
jgi:hypothetical protein